MVWDKFVPKMETQVADAKPGWKLAPLASAVGLATGGAAMILMESLPDAVFTAIPTSPL